MIEDVSVCDASISDAANGLVATRGSASYTVTPIEWVSGALEQGMTLPDKVGAAQPNADVFGD